MFYIKSVFKKIPFLTLLLSISFSTVHAQEVLSEIRPGLLNELKSLGATNAYSIFSAEPVEFDIDTSAGPVHVDLVSNSELLAPNYREEVTTGAGRIVTNSNIQLFKSANAETASNYARFVMVQDEQGETNLTGYLKVDGEDVKVELSSHNPSAFVVGSLDAQEAESIAAACGTDHEHEGEGLMGLSGEVGSYQVGNIKVLELATEADNEYFIAEGNSAANANARILGIMNAIDPIYQYQLNYKISIVFQHVWAVADPYTTVDATGFLSEFGNYWHTNFAPTVTYDLAHLWTTYGLTANNGTQTNIVGVAWLSAVCGYSRYGISKRYTNSSAVVLTAHEIGHNVGANHDSGTCDASWIMCPYLGSTRNVFTSQAKASIAARQLNFYCLSDEATNKSPVSLSASATTLPEASGTSIITATLGETNPSDVIVTLNYGGTATLSSDYTRSTTDITIPAGSLTGSVNISTVSDTRDEDDETLNVSIAYATNAIATGIQDVTLTITDDDPVPTVSISTNTPAISEAGGLSTIVATLSAVSGKTVTVNLNFTGTATLTTDYTKTAASVSIPAGSSSASITINAMNDGETESSETVIATISSATNATATSPVQVTITIVDATGAPAVSLSANNLSISESGTSTVTATLSSVSASDVTVNFGFAGTATLNTDYTRSTGAITILAGATTGSITITAINDVLSEDNETAIVSIASAVNATPVTPQSVTITINDNDTNPTVSLSINNTSIPEAGGSALVTATVSAVSGRSVTVNLSFSETAIVNTDYTRSATSIVINAGSNTGTITLNATNDTLNEDTETAVIAIASAVNATAVNPQQVSVSIVDNDPLPTLTIVNNANTIPEASGSSVLSATLSNISGRTITANLNLSGTATLNSDYTASTNTVTIPAGSSVANITISSVSDSAYEGSETIVATLSSPINATLGNPSTSTITITDDDSQPTVSLNASSTNLYDSCGTLNITATLSNISFSPVTVNLGYAGTASASKYSAASNIVIPAGSSSASITLSAVNSGLEHESDETILVSLNSATNATPSGAQSLSINFVDRYQEGGIDLCDGDSNLPKSPAFLKWTSYLKQWNFLELVVQGTVPLTAGVTVYNIKGEPMIQTAVTIPANSEADTDINALIRQACGFTNPASCDGLTDLDADGLIDSYGLVKVEWEDTNQDARLIGRLSNYRADPSRVAAPGGSYSFALTRELIKASKGKTYAVANTYDPQNLEYLVPNWAEITYIGDASGTDTMGFTVNIYSDSGELKKSQRVELNGLQERDLAAGHDIVDLATGKVVEAVYLVEVVPDDSSKPYHFSLTRYSSNAAPGFEPETYNYSVTSPGRRGAIGTLYAPISRESYTCGTTQDWVEVANVSPNSVDATLVFRGPDGSVVASTTQTIQPKAQNHFNASALLDEGDIGSIDIVSSAKSSLMAQSMVYVFDCDRTGIQTAYVSLAREVGRKDQAGTGNTFISMENMLRTISTKSVEKTINYSSSTFLNEQGAITSSIPPRGISVMSIGDSALNFPTDRYGTVIFGADEEKSYLSEIVRMRFKKLDGKDRLDFVMPTQVN